MRLGLAHEARKHRKGPNAQGSWLLTRRQSAVVLSCDHHLLYNTVTFRILNPHFKSFWLFSTPVCFCAARIQTRFGMSFRISKKRLLAVASWYPAFDWSKNPWGRDFWSSTASNFLLARQYDQFKMSMYLILSPMRSRVSIITLLQLLSLRVS